MKSHRTLIVLVALVAVGVGLAISVALSVVPATTASTPARRNSAGAGGPSTSPRAATPPDNSLADARDADPRSVDRTVLDSPPGLCDDSGPVHVTPHPALAQNQRGPAAPLAPGPLLRALLGQHNPPNEATPTADQPIEPPVTVVQPSSTESAKNEISRIPSERGDRFAINILGADIREVLDLLSKKGELNILASPKVEGKVSASLSNVDIEGAFQAIIKSTGYVAKREGQYIFVGTPEDFVQTARAGDEINTRVYRPSYVTAAELKSLITPILTQGVGIISVTSAADAGIDAGSGNGAGDKYAGGDTFLVRDYETVLKEIDQLVAEVDLRPLQVHIEAMILSVKLDDDYKFGVNFQLLRQFSDMKLGWGTMPDTFATWKWDGGLKFGFLDHTLGSFINALEKIGDTNVIATPRLVVLNKHAAEIQIGKSEGYVNTTQTQTAATQTVEFLELGTLLRIRPFVSNDGMIRLEVHPEISDGEVNVEEGMTIPRKEITQVTTNVMVRDGCTAVIGGLIQEEQQGDRTQVPLLGSLPIVGVAFREKEEKTIRHELIILITPSVVWERVAYDEGARGACEFQRRQSVYAEKMSPIGKRSLGRKCVRRAKAAWEQGDLREALRLAELAVHFDPENRDAIEVRSDVWLGKPYHGTDSSQPEHPAVPTGALDGPQMAPWILQQLGEPPRRTEVPGYVLPPAVGEALPDDVTVLPTPPAEKPGTSASSPAGSPSL
jgi:type IV pilus assembly protein PilQ